MVLTTRATGRLAAALVLAAVLASGQALVAPVPASAGTRTVVAGETLSQVASSLRVSVAKLAEANGIKDVNRVQAGRRLVVPAGAGRAPSAAPPAPGPGSKLPERLRSQSARLALLPLFDAAAREFRVPADLFKAMTWQESGWQNTKVSSTKAVGIGQLMPATVAFVNDVLLKARLDPSRPEHNIRMSARFLAYLLSQNDGDVERTLSSYYQGLASVRRQGPLPETRRYVANVLALRRKF